MKIAQIALALLAAAAALASATPVCVFVNHTNERQDYRESLVSWLREAGARVVNDTSCDFDSYWGLHLQPHMWTGMPANAVVNSVAGCKQVLGEKDSLVRLQRSARNELGVGADEFAPRGYVLPEQLGEFQALAAATAGGDELFARKRLHSHSGAGVSILTAKDIVKQQQQNQTNEDSFVVQKYIADVLLADNKYKFDVRWWAVIRYNNNNKESLEGFMFRDGYAKLACFGGQYDASRTTKKQKRSKCAHVTNSAVQRQCQSKLLVASAAGGGVEDEEGICGSAQPRNVRSKEFQRAVQGRQEGDGGDIGEAMFLGAKRVIEQALRAARWRLDLHAQRRRRERGGGGMFQLLAVDVIYERRNQQLLPRAWLLEINLNGYLQSGLTKVPGAKQAFVDMLDYVGFTDSSHETPRLPSPPPPSWDRLDLGNQVELLTEELHLVEKSMQAKTAAASLRDFMDQHADKESLGGFSQTPNPWKEAARSEGACCVIS